MLCELFRINSHLVWFGTFAQDLGQLSPVFYMFTDREKVFRYHRSHLRRVMHPNWFRIGGVAQDLPNGWDKLVRDFCCTIFPKQLREYNNMVIRNSLFKARTKGIGIYTLEEAFMNGA